MDKLPVIVPQPPFDAPFKRQAPQAPRRGVQRARHQLPLAEPPRTVVAVVDGGCPQKAEDIRSEREAAGIDQDYIVATSVDAPCNVAVDALEIGEVLTA